MLRGDSAATAGPPPTYHLRHTFPTLNQRSAGGAGAGSKLARFCWESRTATRGLDPAQGTGTFTGTRVQTPENSLVLVSTLWTDQVV